MSHRVEYASGSAGMQVYRDLAKAADMDVAEVVSLASEDRLHVAVLRAEARAAKHRNAVGANRARQMAMITKGKRWRDPGRTTDAPDRSERL